MQTPSECSEHGSARSIWYLNKLVWVAGVLVILAALSFVFPLLVRFRDTLLLYIQMMWWAVVLGFLIGGVIDHFIPKTYVSHFLARSKKRTIFYAVLLGFFMSVCSHGILALAVELYKKGASSSAVVAFLLASPWANLPLTLILIGFFGWKAFYLIGGALVIAITSGFVFQFLEAKNWVESNPHRMDFESSFSVAEDVRSRFRGYSWSAGQLARDTRGIWRGAISLGDMVLWWILLGVGIAALASYIPSHVFREYMGPTAQGLTLTLVLATVMEVCSEGTAPLAFELFRQTGAFGNAFVFLMAGVVTDFTEIGLIWVNMGRRMALWLPVVSVPQVVVLGILANFLFR